MICKHALVSNLTKRCCWKFWKQAKATDPSFTIELWCCWFILLQQLSYFQRVAMLSMRIPHLQWPINHELQCSNANQRHLPENIAYKQFLDQNHLLFWPVTGCRQTDKCPKSVNFFSSTPSVQNKQSIQERKQPWYLWWYWIFMGSEYDKGLGSYKATT